MAGVYHGAFRGFNVTTGRTTFYSARSVLKERTYSLYVRPSACFILGTVERMSIKFCILSRYSINLLLVRVEPITQMKDYFLKHG